MREVVCLDPSRSPRRAVCLAILLAAAVVASLPGDAVAQQAPVVWAGADGSPVEFADASALSEFLVKADIIENEGTEVGTTGPRKLTLARDGIQLHAAFRNVDETHSRLRLPDGSYFQRLRDYSGFEVAAYRLSLLLGLDNVPPAEHRTVNREDGTVQVWVEGTMMEKDRLENELRSPQAMEWSRQLQEMLAFDQLIGNVDRNAGNMLIDENWKVWLIDHTRAFQQGDKLTNPERIRMVRRGFWDALQALDRETIEATISHDVDGKGISELMKRHEALVHHIQSLIDQRGEGAVIWE